MAPEVVWPDVLVGRCACDACWVVLRSVSRGRVSVSRTGLDLDGRRGTLSSGCRAARDARRRWVTLAELRDRVRTVSSASECRCARSTRRSLPGPHQTQLGSRRRRSDTERAPTVRPRGAPLRYRSNPAARRSPLFYTPCPSAGAMSVRMQNNPHRHIDTVAEPSKHQTRPGLAEVPRRPAPHSLRSGGRSAVGRPRCCTRGGPGIVPGPLAILVSPGYQPVEATAFAGVGAAWQAAPLL